ncbi:hypothetical protein ABZX99_34195 [Streptomyces antibioticus]
MSTTPPLITKSTQFRRVIAPHTEHAVDQWEQSADEAMAAAGR